jgi:hypothetical protein
LLNLKWEYVDFFGEIPLIKIPGEVAKTRKPRTIPLYHPEMVETLKFAYQARNPSCPWIFQFRGKRLKDYRQGWEDARAAGRLPQRTFSRHATHRGPKHGRAGVRRTDARQISGHRTESVYQRYDIGSEQGAFEAAEKLRRFHEEQQSRKMREICGTSEQPTRPKRMLKTTVSCSIRKAWCGEGDLNPHGVTR